VIPGEYNLELYRGDTEARSFVLFADDAQTVPYDLTGATVRAEIREKTAGIHVVTLSTVILLPNTVVVTMLPTNYVDCPAVGIWDLQITDADGMVLTPVAGAVNVTPDVTDSVVMPTLARR
jgi:hypothetical protein